MKNIRWLIHPLMAVLLSASGCSFTDVKPVDLYPEDSCAQCRMAVSDPAFASQIITEDSEVFKFDDLGCLENYRKKNPDVKVRATFVSDYESKTWLPLEKSVIVKTGISTPMGSGKLAFADSGRGVAFAKDNPPDISENETGCGAECCSGS
ncbi:MAG: nitrous oxide reductase accessory protein NosL [Bacteroidota bacterium]